MPSFTCGNFLLLHPFLRNESLSPKQARHFLDLSSFFFFHFCFIINFLYEEIHGRFFFFLVNKLNSMMVQAVQFSLREVSFFTRRGGLLKIGGDQVLCLRSKGGSKDFFKLKRGITYIFKEIKYFVKHSWSSC